MGSTLFRAVPHSQPKTNPFCWGTVLGFFYPLVFSRRTSIYQVAFQLAFYYLVRYNYLHDISNLAEIIMVFEVLTKDNVEEYIDYLKIAMSEEPNLMFADTVDEKGIKNRVNEPFFCKTTSILAKIDDKVVGRIEYHFYGCIQDGHKMAYVDWVYVLKSYRHRGIAQQLFTEFEKDCVKNDINQYYLIRAKNDEADRFYTNFANVELMDSPILRKHLKQ